MGPIMLRSQCTRRAIRGGEDSALQLRHDPNEAVCARRGSDRLVTPGPTDGSAAPGLTAGVSTLAGAGQAGYVDGNRDLARFANPVNVAYGPDGNLYVADFDNNRLRVVAADGTTATVIAQATFERPFGLAFGPDGTLWVSTDND